MGVLVWDGGAWRSTGSGVSHRFAGPSEVSSRVALEAPSWRVPVGEPLAVTVRVEPPVAGAVRLVSVGSGAVMGDAVTGADGVAVFEVVPDVGMHVLAAEFAGAGGVAPGVSPQVAVVGVLAEPTVVVTSAPQSVVVGSRIVVEGEVSDPRARVVCRDSGVVVEQADGSALWRASLTAVEPVSLLFGTEPVAGVAAARWAVCVVVDVVRAASVVAVVSPVAGQRFSHGTPVEVVGTASPGATQVAVTVSEPSGRLWTRVVPVVGGRWSATLAAGSESEPFGSTGLCSVMARSLQNDAVTESVVVSVPFEVRSTPTSVATMGVSPDPVRDGGEVVVSVGVVPVSAPAPVVDVDGSPLVVAPTGTGSYRAVFVAGSAPFTVSAQVPADGGWAASTRRTATVRPVSRRTGVRQFTATWSANYAGDGSRRDVPDLRCGQWPQGAGEEFSLMGFAVGGLPDGAEVVAARLLLSTVYWSVNTGGAVLLAGHGQVSAPDGVRPAPVGPQARAVFGRKTGSGWFDLSGIPLSGWADGSRSGLAVLPEPGSAGFGVFAGAGSVGAPVLELEFRYWG